MSSLNKKQIEELLPHREPMLLLDQLIDIKTDLLRPASGQNEQRGGVYAAIHSHVPHWQA